MLETALEKKVLKAKYFLVLMAKGKRQFLTSLLKTCPKKDQIYLKSGTTDAFWK